MAAADPRRTRAWRTLRDRVVAEEPTCWLQLPGICTGISTTADHILSVRDHPHLAMDRSNLHGACEPCNRTKAHHPIDTLDTPRRAPALDFFT